MSPRHTPGPWTARTRLVALVVGGNPEFLLADCTVGRKRRAEDVANATLIAAAPDLLELARKYASECGECAGSRVMPDGEDCDECAFIWSVIDAAEGRP